MLAPLLPAPALGTTNCSLAEGSHTFQVNAIDPAGNTDPTPASYNWTIATDNTPPDTAITSNPSTLTNKTNATFIFTSTEPGSTFACSLDGRCFQFLYQSPELHGLANGSHSFQVRATDAAGNTDASTANFSWTIDTSIVTVLQGTVTDRNTGAPIAGVSVSRTGSVCGQTMTDGNGNYSLTAQDLCDQPTGAVRFTGDGILLLNTISYTITASPTILDATLLPGGRLLQGTVTDPQAHRLLLLAHQ